MDPKVTLQHLLDAYAERDLARVSVHANDLEQWLADGGFAPEVDAAALLQISSLLNELAMECLNEGLSLRRKGH